MAVMLREATPRQLRRRGPSIGGVLLGTVAIAVVAAMVVGLGLLSGLLHIGNPFAAETIDRTPPTVLRRLESLSSYRGASANFEVNVDVEKRHRFIPTFIAGQRTVFLAVGSVDAVVDFDHIDASRVVQSDGGTSVVVTLPHARTLHAVVDTKESHVSTRDRGIADRLGGVLSDSPTSDASLYRLAARKMDRAASQTGVEARAERNTTKMLQGLLGDLGYDHVTVRYVDAKAGATTPGPKSGPTSTTQPRANAA